MVNMMDLKSLHYELLMNSFLNRTVLLLPEETSFASHSFSHHGISNSLSPVMLYFVNKREDKIEIFLFLLLITHSCFG